MMMVVQNEDGDHHADNDDDDDVVVAIVLTLLTADDCYHDYGDGIIAYDTMTGYFGRTCIRGRWSPTCMLMLKMVPLAGKSCPG